MPRFEVRVRARCPQRLAHSAQAPWQESWGRGHRYSFVVRSGVVHACVLRADDAQTAHDVVVAKLKGLARAHLGVDLDIERVVVRRRVFAGYAVPAAVGGHPEDGGDDGRAGALVPRTPRPPTGSGSVARDLPAA